MKRLIASIALLLIVSTYLLSCEKDDICAGTTPTTPSLMIEFYQKESPSVPMSISKLEYYVDGSTKIDSVNNITKMKLPLKTDEDVTKWNLTYNRTIGNVKIVNTDALEFSYKRTVTYVSRACGYKTTFKLEPNLQDKPNPILTDPKGDGFWISGEPIVITTNIENEDKVHIKIYL